MNNCPSHTSFKYHQFFYFYWNCLCPSSLLRFINAFETIVCICRDNSVCLNVILLNKTCVDILSHTHISPFLPDVQFKDFMRTQNNRSLNLTFISCQFSRLNKKISYTLMQWMEDLNIKTMIIFYCFLLVSFLSKRLISYIIWLIFI